MPYIDFSESVNASSARDRGLQPKSRIPQVPNELIERFCRPSEWHHTSSQYNETDFYDVDEVLATFGIAGDPADADEEAVRSLAEFKKREKPREQSYTGRVGYLDLAGSGRWAHYRECVFVGPFTVKGNWIRFGGRRMKLDGNRMGGYLADTGECGYGGFTRRHSWDATAGVWK